MKTLSILVVVCFIVGTWSSVYAQELQPGKNTVSYLSYGENVAAHLYLPEDYVAGEKRPAIVIVPPATGVKEQTIGVYAEKLSQKGFVTLAFDPRGWGESEGIPQLLDPYKVADDTKTAMSYLHTLDVVDTNNTFNMGICMGSGFAALAAAVDSRVKALAVVSPYLDGAEIFLANAGNSSAALRNSILAIAARGRQQYYETGEPLIVKVVPETEEEINTAPTEISKGMAGYYLPGKPGDTPTWKNGFNAMTAEHLVSWSIYPYTHLFEAIPTLVIYGEQAASKAGAEKFYQQINGPKERVIVEGADHFDLYWKPEYVDPAVEKITGFLNAYIQ